MFFSHFSPTIWLEVEKLVKIRLENMVKNYICDACGTLGIYNDYERNYNKLSIACREWIIFFDTKEEIIEILINKLNQNYIKEESDYVVKFYGKILLNNEFIDNDIVKNGIRYGLENGNYNCKRLLELDDDFLNSKGKIYEAFGEYYNNFMSNDNYFNTLPF